MRDDIRQLLLELGVRKRNVLVRSAGVWTQQKKLVASDGAASDLFGVSVGLAGERGSRQMSMVGVRSRRSSTR